MTRHLQKWMSAYKVDYPKRLAYMWQASEYSTTRLVGWWFKLRDFSTFTRRGDLVLTNASRVVRMIITVIAIFYWVVNVLIIDQLIGSPFRLVIHGIAMVVLYPLIVVIISIVPVNILKLLKRPVDTRKLRLAHKILTEHPGKIIVVAGSYGKTSMKEMLVSVLRATGKNVRSTEGNKNTLQSIAGFAQGLNGLEEYVVIEFGEGKPGDIEKMTKLTDPDYAFITGLAPNHLDQYKSVENIMADLNSLINHTAKECIYINGDSELLDTLADPAVPRYSTKGFGGWRVSDASVEIDRLAFRANCRNKRIDVQVGLLGRHNIGPLIAIVAILDELAIPLSDIGDALSKTKPYEHRMEPRLLNGAWFIDDTYNGNIDGMLAGLHYLAELQTTGRKIYATPGLVDQGTETIAVHTKLGSAIATCNPDQVYLMKNSVQPIILEAMEKSGYKGKTTIIDDPLSFYTHIQDVLAEGDVILCQNDWPDIYN